MSRSLSIKGKTQANTALTTTINYVNPNATDEQLVSLATAFNGLTNNTLGDISRIDKESLTNVSPKLPRNVQVLNISEQPITEVKIDSITNSMSDPFMILVKYNSDDYPNDQITRITSAGEFANDETLFIATTRYNDGTAYLGLTIMLAKPSTLTPLTLHFTIGATNTYQAATFDIPIVS